ncbi:MAG: NAD(P)/FAD-dependent oxidoreductase [Dehalococcoidia bacterium]|nr:NAD(P)/FAD-dependent oxidoreductase [Dehalococcoidia bacterium]
MAEYDVVVIGGGAAGLMCAIEAGRRGRRVLVVEHADRVGKKILISGGGRCNFTNVNASPENYLSANPPFCRSALARSTPQDFVSLVESYSIPYHEKELGQLFCDGSAREIVQMLLAECQLAGVEIACNCTVSAVERPGDGFALVTSAGAVTCRHVVVASGGRSIPKMGASGFGYDLAQRFGHTIVPTRPGLVPLTLGQGELAHYGELSGVSLSVRAWCEGASFAGPLLFTHRGLSGPAILQVSSYWQQGEPLHVDLLPGMDASAWLSAEQRSHPGAELRTSLSDVVPKRLAVCLCDVELGSRPLRQYSTRDLQSIAGRLKGWEFRPIGTEGYRTAEVTVGGVDTTELSSSTMESRLVSGLYFIGEVVDVTGWLGGYNFQWAWASGYAAGQAV